MIYKQSSIYKMGGGVTLKKMDFSEVADDWQDITNDFVCVNGNSWTQTNKFVYSQSLKLIYFQGGGSFKRSSSYSGAGWQEAFRYTGNLFNTLSKVNGPVYLDEKNGELIYSDSGVNTGINLFNALDYNGTTNGCAVIPNYFNYGGYDHTFVFKLFIPQTHTNTYGVQFNQAAYKILD
jgi:hypothetical protein